MFEMMRGPGAVETHVENRVETGKQENCDVSLLQASMVHGHFLKQEVPSIQSYSDGGS